MWALCAAEHQSVCVTWPGSLLSGHVRRGSLEAWQLLPWRQKLFLATHVRHSGICGGDREWARCTDRERETASILSDSDSSDWVQQNGEWQNCEENLWVSLGNVSLGVFVTQQRPGDCRGWFQSQTGEEKLWISQIYKLLAVHQKRKTQTKWIL